MRTRDRLAALSPEQRRTILAGLTPEQLHQLAYSWQFWARPAQLPPEGRGWRCWVLQGGRGAGKTKTASETIRADVEAGRRRSIGAMGMTADTVRRDMVQGRAFSRSVHLGRNPPSKPAQTGSYGRTARSCTCSAPRNQIAHAV